MTASTSATEQSSPEQVWRLTAQPSVSPVIGALIVRFCDDLPDETTRTRLLAPLLPSLLNTVGSPELERRRALVCADWAIHSVASFALDLVSETSLQPGLPGTRPRRLPSLLALPWKANGTRWRPPGMLLKRYRPRLGQRELVGSV
jgi:hypothetical protein